MTRPIRIEYENAYYHVMNRGQGRKCLFHDESYFKAFLQTLSEADERFGLQVHAYCLMSNHYHLLVKTPLGNLQRAMRHIGGVYTQRYNRKKKTDGQLFRGRYKAILVDHDAYLLQLSKYIHRNPSEAGMVEAEGDYVWSSYPAYIGFAHADSWLHREDIYGQLNSRGNDLIGYQAYVEESDVDEKIASFYRSKRQAAILGADSFIERIKKKINKLADEVPRVEKRRVLLSIETIVACVATYYGVPSAEIYDVKKGRGLKNRPRKIAMYLGQKLSDYRLNELASVFGLKHYGGVSNAISMIKQEIDQDKLLQQDLNDIINRLDP